MTTYNITSNLLNTTSRNLWIVARNSSSAPVENWVLWVVIAFTALAILATAVYVIKLSWSDIEYYFWSKKYEKNLKKK